MKSLIRSTPEFGMIFGASFLYMVGMVTLLVAVFSGLIAVGSMLVKFRRG